MQQRQVGYDIQTTAMLKRGNIIDRQLQDIDRVKQQDEIIQQVLQKKKDEESVLEGVKSAATLIRRDLKEVIHKQSQFE